MSECMKETTPHDVRLREEGIVEYAPAKKSANTTFQTLVEKKAILRAMGARKIGNTKFLVVEQVDRQHTRCREQTPEWMSLCTCESVWFRATGEFTPA
jgi:hypothetical protein